MYAGSARSHWVSRDDALAELRLPEQSILVVIEGQPGTGKTNTYVELARAIADAANASGASRREIQESLESEWAGDPSAGRLVERFRRLRLRARPQRRAADRLTASQSVLVPDWMSPASMGVRSCRTRAVRPVGSPEPSGGRSYPVLLALLPSFVPVDPFEALLESLQRLIRIGRRADVSRQLAVQRLKLRCRAARSTPDVPPGELVTSSTRVPRGPGLPRMAPVILSAIRGDRRVLT